ncbi:MAG: glutaredoxin family protein [Thermodesulfobacteriota bacterium]
MPPVKIYTLSTCSHCKSTKSFLKQCNVDYDYVDVDLLTGDDRQKIIEEVRELNPRLSFPTIVIGDRVIVGFKEDEILAALGK